MTYPDRKYARGTIQAGGGFMLPVREIITAEALRLAWEPTKTRLVGAKTNEGLRVRIHRACRALEQAEVSEGDGGDPRGLDTAFVLRWISLNALYGHWDPEEGRSVPDRVALDGFTSQVSGLDGEGRVAVALDALRDDARELLECPFLIDRFWSVQFPTDGNKF